LPISVVAPNQIINDLALKNRVKERSEKSREKACMTEMMSVIECLNKFGKDQTMCSTEIQKFDQCFVKFKADQAALKAEQSKGKIPIGTKLNSKEINQVLKKWPQSMRTRQIYIQPDFDPMKQPQNKV